MKNPIYQCTLSLKTVSALESAPQSHKALVKEWDPVASCTKLGWTITSPDHELDTTNMLLTQTSRADYEELCRLDVLRLEDSPTGDKGVVYEEFKE